MAMVPVWCLIFFFFFLWVWWMWWWWWFGGYGGGMVFDLFFPVGLVAVVVVMAVGWLSILFVGLVVTVGCG